MDEIVKHVQETSELLDKAIKLNTELKNIKKELDSIGCQKKRWGGCCCDCYFQQKVNKHPGNVTIGKGRVTELLGYICMYSDELITFHEDQHGHCECWSPK